MGHPYGTPSRGGNQQAHKKSPAHAEGLDYWSHHPHLDDDAEKSKGGEDIPGLCHVEPEPARASQFAVESPHADELDE